MNIPELVSTVSNIIVGVIAIFGSFYVVRQVREARKARLLAPYFEMDRRLHEQREDRRLLYSWTGERNDDWRKIYEKVAVNFDVLGALVREDMIYRPIVFKIYWDVIIKTWDILRAYIISERNPNSKASTYMKDFEYLYEEAVTYMNRMRLDYPQVQTTLPSMSTSKPVSDESNSS